jgi:hypothetical protein
MKNANSEPLLHSDFLALKLPKIHLWQCTIVIDSSHLFHINFAPAFQCNAVDELADVDSGFHSGD